MKLFLTTIALSFTALAFTQEYTKLTFVENGDHYSFSVDGPTVNSMSGLFLYDAAGRIVLERTVIPGEESGDLPPMEAGVFFYRLIEQGAVVADGKILIK